VLNCDLGIGFENIENSFDFQLVALAFGDFAIYASANANVGRDALSTLCVDCSVAVVDGLRDL